MKSKCLVSEETVKKLNDLLKDFFRLNAVFDNMAYSLENQGYHDTSELFHKKISHKPPVFADFVSDFGYNLGIRFVREGIGTEDKEYTGVEEIFEEVYNEFIKITDKIVKLIEEFEFDYKNRYVVVNLEELLNLIQPYVRVASTWKDKANEYTTHDNLYKFDKDFHTFIKIPD